MKGKLGTGEHLATGPGIRTIIVEDSPVTMRALANLLEANPLIHCVGTAGDGHAGLKLVEQHEPDLVLVDMEMPGLGGLALVEMLRRKFPAMRLIVVSTHEGYVWQQLSQTRGADAFVTKRRLPMEFPELLQRLFPKSATLGRPVANAGATK